MISEIPISKGVFKTQNSRELRNSEFAHELVNLMIGQAGANFDRPTLALHATLDSTEIIGSHSFGGLLVFVTLDRKVYTVTLAGDVTDVTGVLLPGADRATFAYDKDALYIAGGGAPIKWEGPGTVTALLGGSPPDMTHIVYLDGFLIGNRQLVAENFKVIQFCDYETPETWPGTSIFSAVADPDPVAGLTVSQRELYVVGQKTTEVWQNVGSYPVPFSRAYVWQYGTPAPYSIHSADNSVFFIDQDHRIMRIVGRQPVRMSEAIENDLFKYETVTDCWTSSFTWKGSIHVLFVFPTAQKAWSIDLKNNQWTEWAGYDNGPSRVRINSVFYLEDSGRVFAGDYRTGKVWEFSATEKTDAEGIFKRSRKFCHRDGGGSIRKQANLVRINLDRNVAPEYEGTTSETNPTLELRWKDDNRPWSDWRRASLGERGERRYYSEFRRLGIYRTRQYELQMSDPAELNIVSVETDEEVMAS